MVAQVTDVPEHAELSAIAHQFCRDVKVAELRFSKLTFVDPDYVGHDHRAKGGNRSLATSNSMAQKANEKPHAKM